MSVWEVTVTQKLRAYVEADTKAEAEEQAMEVGDWETIEESDWKLVCCPD